jgi:hypothetical protein
MTEQDYKDALASRDYNQVTKAYEFAKHAAWDMRYRKETRDCARHYLSRLTSLLADLSRALIEGSQ